MNRRANRLLAGLGAALLFLPAVADNYLLSIVTLFLFFAYAGQAWNIMMGFAGQLSLGHSLYLGVGGYAAAALYFHFGIGPWAGLWLAILICALFGAAIGTLAFRYGVSGVYFTLLTIAFAEFTRVGFDHFAWVGGSGGMFLKVAERDQIDLIQSPRYARDVLLRHPCARCGRLCPERMAVAQPRRLLLAGHP